MKVLKTEKSKPPVRFNLEYLKDLGIKANYAVEIQNSFQIVLEDLSTSESTLF